jgi:divalent metal cation (Fe/Co/Zn/Cd) transporter
MTVKEGHDISHNLKDALLKELPQLMDVLIHVEPDSIAPSTN